MDYTSYSAIKADLKQQLSLLSNWSNTLFYGVYDAIISMIAYAINKDAYLGYFLYKESGWLTAEKLESLASMSWMLSYVPYRKSGATGNIVISGSSTFNSSYVWQGNHVFIPKWTKFSNSSKSVNVYCTEFTTYYNNTTGNQTIPVREGVPKQYTYIAQGVVNEKIYLYSNKIDNSLLEVYIVDSLGVVLSQVSIVDNLYYYSEPSTYYCTVTNSVNFDYIYLTFGDDVSTKKLSTGTYVLIKYAETNGAEGNITSSGTVTKALDTLYDTNGNAVTNVYFTNTDIISGGLNYEDIESIRNNAPNLFGAGFRCGTLADWNSVVASIPYIAKSQVWSINSIGGSSLISEQNTMYITALDSEGNNLTTTQKNDTVSLLENNYSSPTEVIQFEDPEKVYLYFDVTATIQNSTSDVMKNIIKESLYEAYKSIDSEFALKLYQSGYTSMVSSIPNIVYHDTEAKPMDYNIGYVVNEYVFKCYYPSTVDDKAVLVTVNSPEIWIKQKIDYVWQTPIKVGKSSGSNFISTGNVVPTSNPDVYHPVPFTYSNTSISYETYTYSFIVDQLLSDYTNNNKAAYGINNPAESDPLGYIICMTYSTKDGNGDQTNSIRLSSQYQITDVDPYFIFTSITES